jgi:hypothetical protein
MARGSNNQSPMKTLLCVVVLGKIGKNIASSHQVHAESP